MSRKASDPVRKPRRLRRHQLTFEHLEGRWMLSNVLTYHYNNSRTGADTAETTLTPSNVNSTQFGEKFVLPTDGAVYAQPLLKTGVSIAVGPGQGTHNVLFVATENDSVYAFDAQDKNPAQGYLWMDHLVPSGESPSDTTQGTTSVNIQDIVPEIGILATPVIDPSTNTLYVVTLTQKVLSSTTTEEFYRLHALDITTGAEKFGGPITIGDTTMTATPNSSSPSGYSYTFTFNSGPSVPGNSNAGNGTTVTFNACLAQARAALTLVNGVVYVTFASHGDQGGAYAGWLLGYNASNLQQQVSVFTPGPNENPPENFGGGMWEAGDGPAADSNNLYVGIGNGPFDPSIGDYGESAVRLNISSGLSVASYFTPANQAYLNQIDLDMGVGGLVLLPNNELITAGKYGTLFLLNRSSMGGYQQGSGGTDKVLSEVSIGSSLKNPMAYFNGKVFVGGNGAPLQAYSIASNTGAPLLSFDYQSSNTFGPANCCPPGSDADGLGTNPIISANGTSNAIVWALDNSGYATNSPTVLYAYDASNLSMLYSSTQAGSRDTAGAAVKFTAPVVANGLVYVSGQSSVTVYGLLAPNLVATAGNGKVALRWTRESGATSYNIYRSNSSGTETFYKTVSATTTSFTDTGLTNGTTYYYQVTAIYFNNNTGASNESNKSNEVSATPQTKWGPGDPVAPDPGGDDQGGNNQGGNNQGGNNQGQNSQ